MFSISISSSSSSIIISSISIISIIICSISVRINIIGVFNIISTINFSISIITGFRAMLRLTAASTTTVVRIMAIAQARFPSNCACASLGSMFFAIQV